LRSPASRLLRTSYPADSRPMPVRRKSGVRARLPAMRCASQCRWRWAIAFASKPAPTDFIPSVICHSPQIRCSSALARDAVCQAMQVALRDRVRQQASSYGRRAPVICHSPQIRCRPVVARERVLSGNADGAGGIAFASKPAPTDVIPGRYPADTCPLQIRCRSALARERGVSGNAGGAGRLRSPASRLLRTSYLNLSWCVTL
jgi:hypothetical protein